KPSSHEVERGAVVVHLAGPAIVRPGAAADAAEVEPQHRDADPRERLRRLIHDLRMHRPAVERVRMAGGGGGGGLADRKIEQRLERPGRAGDLTQRLYDRHRFAISLSAPLRGAG